MGFLFGAAMLGALVVAGVVLLMGLLLKMVFWAVTVPIRLVFSLLFFPVWLAGKALRAVGLLFLAPVFAVVAVCVAGAVIIAGLLALIVPLLPIVVITFLIWIVVRSLSNRAVPAA